jgi:hypothetical protein
VRPVRRRRYPLRRRPERLLRQHQLHLTELFDQSPQHNNLTVEGVGGNGSAEVDANSGTVLDAVDCEKVNGTVVDQWTGLGNTCQQ